MAYLSSSEASNFQTVKTLAEQAIHRSVSEIQPLGGCVGHNFLVNQEIILKIASARFNLSEWQRTAVNAPVLQQHLSVQIPVPILHTLDLNGRPIPALSYHRLPGYIIKRDTFSEQSNAFRCEYLSQLNEKIQELHQIPPEILPIQPLGALRQAAGMLFKNQYAANVFAGLARWIFPYKAERDVLLHGDLHTENICFDGKKITGILDFDSLCIGHPVFEFRPDLCLKKEDNRFMMENYIEQNPSEFSLKIGEDFHKKYKTLFFLLAIINLIKPRKCKQNRFGEILQTLHQQPEQSPLRAFKLKHIQRL